MGGSSGGSSGHLHPVVGGWCSDGLGGEVGFAEGTVDCVFETVVHRY